MDILLSLLALDFALSMIFLFKSTPRIKKRPKRPLPPGPMGYPIVGCLPEMVRNKPTFRWMHNYMQRFNTKIACFRVGGINVVTVTSPKLSPQFLKEHDSIFATRPDNILARLVSNGYLSVVLTPTGDQWKKMRRVMVSEVLTTHGVHEWLHAKRCEEADHLVRYVYNQCQKIGAAVNVREVAQLYCGCVIRKMVFGERFFGPGREDGGPGFEEREHMDALFTIIYYTYGFAIGDCVPFLEMFYLDGHKKMVTNALECLRKYQEARIDNRIEMWRNGVRNTKEGILDVLISLKDSNNIDPLVSVEDRDQSSSYSAVDNPSNAVEWALGEMINDPCILDLASKELDEVVGRKRLVQESDLSQLNYIKACVKEAFRLHPVAPFNLPHVSSTDTVVGGYFIPEGSHVLLSRIGLGRNPRIWEDPLKFKPECHFSSNVVVLNDPKLQILSFSSGRRGCPAIKLGSTMTTILLARIIQGFSWRPPSDAPVIDLVESHVDLFLAKPLFARATPRLEPHVYH